MTKAKLPISISCMTIIGMAIFMYTTAPAFADCGFDYESDVRSGCPLEGVDGHPFWSKDSDGNLTIYDQDAAEMQHGYFDSPKWRKDNDCGNLFTTNQCRVCIGLDPLPRLQEAGDRPLRDLKKEAVYNRKHPDQCRNGTDGANSN